MSVNDVPAPRIPHVEPARTFLVVWWQDDRRDAPTVRGESVFVVRPSLFVPPLVRDGPGRDAGPHCPGMNNAPVPTTFHDSPAVREQELAFDRPVLGQREETNQIAAGQVPKADSVLAEVLGGEQPAVERRGLCTDSEISGGVVQLLRGDRVPDVEPANVRVHDPTAVRGGPPGHPGR